MLRLVCSASLLGSWLLVSTALAKDRIDLSPRLDPAAAVLVTVELEAGGHNLVRSDSDGADVDAQQQLPMSVSASLQYEERRLAAPTATAAAGTLLAVRKYQRAEAVLKVGDSGRAPRLAEGRHLIAVEHHDRRPLLYCADRPLSRDELDLIDVVGNSLVLDQLLPAAPVAVGDTWGNDAAVIGPLLTLDTVAACEVQSVLQEANANFAKVRLAGTVHGSVDGAATEQELRAVYLFNRRLGRITQLNLAVRESRSIGGATPGVDAVAKLQLKVEPLPEAPRLSDQAIAQIRGARRSPARDLVYEALPLGFRVRHDRQWFITSEQRESVTLRRVDAGDLVAQCTLSVLPPKSAGRQTSLQQFQKDVILALGKSFGELVSSRQWQNAAGHYCYELVARGLVEEVPVEWHHYLVAPESGHRVAVAVTIEKPMIERLAHADRELVESLELFPRMPAAQTASPTTPRTVK